MVEGVPQKFTISKRYSRKITSNYQSYDFSTELSTQVEVSSGQELLEAASKLFLQAKVLTEDDINNTFNNEENASNVSEE